MDKCKTIVKLVQIGYSGGWLGGWVVGFGKYGSVQAKARVDQKRKWAGNILGNIKFSIYMLSVYSEMPIFNYGLNPRCLKLYI